MPTIPMTPITDSSMIAAHGYDPESRTLRIQFKSGAHYDVADVPLDKYAAFTGAHSPGKFFNSRIKPVHDVRKVEP